MLEQLLFFFHSAKAVAASLRWSLRLTMLDCVRQVREQGLTPEDFRRYLQVHCPGLGLLGFVGPNRSTRN